MVVASAVVSLYCSFFLNAGSRWRCCCCRFDVRSMLSGEIVCQHYCPDRDNITVRDLNRAVHQLLCMERTIRYPQPLVIHGPAMEPLADDLCVWGTEVPEVVAPRVRLRQKTSRSHVSLQKYFPEI